MKPETPEWKKEIAEKVKAYGERKKRLITPPGPVLESIDPPLNTREVPVVPSYSKPQEPVFQQIQEQHPETPLREPKPSPSLPTEPLHPPSLEVWTDDLRGVSEFEQVLVQAQEEHSVAGGPYTGRRLLAGLIDHTILVILLLVFLGAFSILTGESIDAQLISPWKVTIPAFLIFHFIYYVYFFRATRQTPGMVFLSLELRDPVSSVIPVGKVLARWISMLVINVFNLLPVLIGKPFLLMDLISATEMRSFK